MPQDRKRKQTKKEKLTEVADRIGQYTDKTLKDNFIRNLVQGGEICAQNILDMINDGATVEEVKSFCENLLKVDDKTWLGEKEDIK